MKKTLKLWLALALALVTGVQAWAQDAETPEPKTWSRTLTFSFNYFGEYEDAKTAVKDAKDIFNAGSLDNIKEVTALTRVYQVASNTVGNGYSIRLGNATYPKGELGFTLANPVKATTIRIQARQYSASENKITVNGKELELTSSWAYYSIDLVDEKNPKGQDVSAISISSEKRAYIRRIYVYYNTSELTPRDMYFNLPAGTDLGVYLEEQAKAQLNNGYVLRDLTLSLDGGKYTTSKPITAYRNLTINGNGSTVEAATLAKPNFKGDKDTIQSFIQMADSVWASKDLNENSCMMVDQIAIYDLNVDSVKSFFFYDSNKKYVFNDFMVSNCKIMLKTAESTEAAFEFKACGAMAFTIQNSTVYQVGEKNVNYFTKYNNGVVPDKAVSDYKGTTFFTYTNNTFYNVASSQWHNGGRIANKASLMTMIIQRNIWANCASNILRRMFASKSFSSFKKDDNGKPLSVVENNTFGKYDENWKWTAEDQGSYGNKSDLNDLGDVDTNPQFDKKKVEEGIFTLGKQTLQNGLGTGDTEWRVAGTGNTYYARHYEITGKETEFVDGGSVNFSGNYGDYGCKENNLVMVNINPWGSYYDENNEYVEGDYKVKSVEVYIDANWGDAKAPLRRAPGLLQTVEVKKLKDNQYYFFMPRSDVRVKVIYERVIKNWWVESIPVQEISQTFEGEVKPTVLVEDRLQGQLFEVDENGNPVLDENNNIKYLWKDEEKTKPLYKVLKEGTDYTVEYSNNTQATTETLAIATIKGMGNYAGQVDKQFTIVRVLEVPTEEEVGEDGLVAAQVVSEENKTCVITRITAQDGETTLTIPTEVVGYSVVAVANNAATGNFDKITDVYLPAIGEDGEGIIAIADGALLPKGFTHPRNMFNVHVPVQVLDDYANQPGVKQFAKYAHLMAEITIPESGYATFSTGVNVQFDEAVEVNIVKAYSAEAVKKEAIKGNMVKANTGVLLYGKAGKYNVYTIDENSQIADVIDNLLVAVVNAQHYPIDAADAAANAYFILKNGEFKAVADNTNAVPSCKAILQVAKTEPAAAAPVLVIFDGSATGIQGISVDLKNATFYDMNGRKIQGVPAQKGVYILNGKKVVIK